MMWFFVDKINGYFFANRCLKVSAAVI